MFETSVVRAQAQAARGRVSLLTASIVAHTAVIIGTIAVSIASVDFPAAAPKEYARAPYLVPVRIPPPLGNPNGGARPQTQPATPRPVTPTQITAPATVPETITPAETPSNGTGDSSTAGGTEPGPVGVPWGVRDSIGDLDAPPVPLDLPVQQPVERIYEAHEVQAPVLISRIEPRYPAIFMKAGPAATVVVRCVIDRNGSVRDPEVIVPAMEPFNQEVLRVLPHWRYKAATLNGRAVDSYLNLTVHFAVKR